MVEIREVHNRDYAEASYQGDVLYAGTRAIVRVL